MTITKVAHTYSDDDHVVRMYMIIKAGDPNNIMFNTMGGDRFFPIHKPDGEWEGKVILKTLDEAEQYIVQLRKEGRLMDVQLAPMLYTETTKRDYIEYVPPFSTEQIEKYKILKTMDEFENLMQSRSSWKVHTLKVLRTDKGSYSHPGIQKAFEAFCILQEPIPEK